MVSCVAVLVCSSEAPALAVTPPIIDAAALSFLMSIGTFLLLYLITAVSSRSRRHGDA